MGCCVEWLIGCLRDFTVMPSLAVTNKWRVEDTASVKIWLASIGSIQFHVINCGTCFFIASVQQQNDPCASCKKSLTFTGACQWIQRIATQFQRLSGTTRLTNVDHVNEILFEEADFGLRRMVNVDRETLVRGEWTAVDARGKIGGQRVGGWTEMTQAFAGLDEYEGRQIV